MAIDGHVIGRVGEHHVRLLGPEHAAVAFGLLGVGAENTMLAKNPKVP
jgi:hypothetical protein